MKAAKTDLFEHAPVRRAVLSQIVPAVASQMIVLTYNLADTWFVGMLNDRCRLRRSPWCTPPLSC